MANNQGYYDHAPPADHTQNPWADESGTTPHQTNPFQHQERQQPELQYSNQDYSAPPSPPPGHQQNPWSSQPSEDYTAPPRPPPSHSQGYGNAPNVPPRRVGTFDEGPFVPESERGEQREAMEQFELSNSKPQSTDDRNVEELQRQFPKLDGALVAAIYGDSKDMGATREMLEELASSQQ